MFLKSLTLKGFKSFADATTLEFEPGVTVVVGPNGSGKSNVVDAVAWVLGAQGPRSVRSAKMEDVIFAGTPKRPALGRAEVSLTIDNSARRLPIEFSEVTITRTLFRTGESEYAINKVPCRLLDVQDLLSDTGVGRQQHVIISQGNIDAILSSRPEERRLVIEEAAGILKYRRRKERAERRLESTEASLVRLQDLLREVRRQLGPLRRQAEAARRHDDLFAELTSLRRHLAGVELVEIEGRLERSARTRAELADAETELRRALGDLDAEIEAADAAVADSRARDEAVDLAEGVSRSEAARARAQGLAAVISERRHSLERELTAQVDADVVSSLESEAAELARALEDTEAEATELLGHERDVTEAEEALAGETAEVERQWAEPAGPLTDPAAEVRAELGALRSSLERDRSELRRLESRDASLGQRVARLADEQARLRRTVDEAEAAKDPLQADLYQKAAEMVVAERAAADAEEARRTAEGERHRSVARAETLAQALDEARARAGAERLADIEGVVGTLLELVEVDEGWETAFEAAAGEVIAAVIVDGVDTARRSLDHLRSLGASGAVVALPGPGETPSPTTGGPLVALPGPGETPSPTAGEAVVALPGPGEASRGAGGPDRGDPAGLPAGAEALARHVRARLPAVGALLAGLMAPAVVVDGGWAEALDLAKLRPELVVVTRAGDRCAGGIWRVGAGGAGATGAALDEARRRSAAAEAALETALDRGRQARDRREGARTAHAEALSRTEANLSRQRGAAEALHRVDSELGDARHDAAAVREERSETATRLARAEARLGELEEALPALEKAAAAEAERALAERLARARLAERQAAVAALRRDFEVRVAGLEERRVLTGQRLADVEARLQRNVLARAEAATRRERLAGVAAATARLGALVAERQRRLDRLVDTLREARRRETEASRALTDRLEQLRRQRAVAERQLAELGARAGRAELDDADARLHFENLVETVRRDLGGDVEATRGAPCPELPEGTDAPGRRAQLEEELRRLGPINPLALEEHAALEERHRFLAEQLDDVQAARRELAKVVRAIDTEIVEVFRSAYLDVAENFSVLFATLFPGGEGRLRMTDPDQLLDTGIELEARPSGKNVRRLSLLSGGERSLTALAFLFAVFRSRPSPFYLMDEVEAALDDVNLHRFLELVHAFREDAQLVIVSHQKRTMEAADCLYGVTMAPAGSSRVVSQKVGASAG